MAMGKFSVANIKKTIYYLKRNGIRNTWYAAKERMEEAEREPYRYEAPGEEVLWEQRAKLPPYQGLISILVPTYRTHPKHLCEMVDSVLRQTYPNWELILADATEDDSVRLIVGSYVDERIRYIRLEENAGIAANSNRALEQASGEYVGLLDHDDILTEDALYEVALRIGKGAKMVYSDEDKCNGDATQYFDVNFKENFNLNLLLSNNYICHFMVMERSLIQKLGFRSEYDGAQDYDLILRGAEALLEREEQIVHIPKVLYHWRCHVDSTAENPQSKQYAYEAGLRALQDFADRQKWNAKAEHLKHLGFYRLQYITDVFENRTDLGAVGGRVLKNGKVKSGRITEQGMTLYSGLPMAYSGYMHRAVLTQDAAAVDIRCIRIRRECIPIFEEITGVVYKEKEETGLFDVELLPKDTDYLAVSLALGKAIRAAGYRILYDPSVSTKCR